MEPRSKKVSIGGGEDVTTLHYAASRQGKLGATLVLAHGAGASQKHPFMVSCAEGLAARGVDVVTFNFLYTEIGKKSPDPEAVLETCARAVIAAVAPDSRAAFLGGKSLGGRVASHLVAKGMPTRGLVFLGYPLHPPGKDQLRSEHWDKLGVPCLFVQGTRDPFGTPAELTMHVKKITGPVRIVAVEGGDHSWEVPKRMGLSTEEVIARAMDSTVAWLREIGPAT
ncbi:MAG: alpha/beta family hydrolase [Polyangiaceae bacterium]